MTRHTDDEPKHYGEPAPTPTPTPTQEPPAPIPDPYPGWRWADDGRSRIVNTPEEDLQAKTEGYTLKAPPQPDVPEPAPTTKAAKKD